MRWVFWEPAETRNHEGAPGVGWAQRLNSRGGSSRSLGFKDDGVQEKNAAGKVFSAVGIMCTAPEDERSPCQWVCRPGRQRLEGADGRPSACRPGVWAAPKVMLVTGFEEERDLVFQF